MKQLRNILTGVLLACGLSLPAVSMQADSIPAAQNGLVAELDSMAQRDDVTPAEQEPEYALQHHTEFHDHH